jgi:hypothetical protein
MQLLDDLKETGRYWKLKEEAQDRTLWRTQFGRGYGPVARQILDLDVVLKAITKNTIFQYVTP